MTLNERDYDLLRAAQEQDAAERAVDPLVRQLHRDMAELYLRRSQRPRGTPEAETV